MSDADNFYKNEKAKALQDSIQREVDSLHRTVKPRKRS